MNNMIRKLSFIMQYCNLVLLCCLHTTFLQPVSSEVVQCKDIKMMRLTQDDDQLFTDIMATTVHLYESLINISGMYLSGVVVDTNQLYEKVLYECTSHIFIIMRLLLNYSPKMIQSPALKPKQKLKRMIGVSLFLGICVVWYKEGFYKNAKKNSLEQHYLMNNTSLRTMAQRPATPSDWKM
ncbi:hypothetical protein KBD08_03555 [Candidatus Babeliales bacterium]|nr:hypothetical protein [Candidatus Babeliales bacterium]